jgi:hypothetical protein
VADFPVNPAAANRAAWVNAIARALAAFLRAIARAAVALWHEVTGFFFAIFALIGAGGIVREYGLYRAGKTGPTPLAVAVVFTLVFAYFAATSFWRARRKQP